MTKLVSDRQIVVPGEALAEGDYRVGENVYRHGKTILSTMVGIARVEEDRVSVIALHGFYMPAVGDVVIGIVEDVGVTHWLVDINAPYPGVLRASEAFGRGFDPTRHELLDELKIGDVLIAKVLSFDRTHDPVLTLGEGGLGKIRDGVVVSLTPSKVPRLIGRKGSMLGIIQQKTGCQLTVGQNGMVLARSQDKRMENLVIKIIKLIEREAHTSGLTNRVAKLLDAEIERMKGD
ncbi:MAG: RNA-binding protein [Candidatus Brockarchaeota archaeon]|nr:RNA-binding protein [Candidatus Brockarchaeota archaeon]